MFLILKKNYITIDDKIATKLIQFSEKTKNTELSEDETKVIKLSSKKLIFILAITITHELAHYKVSINFSAYYI